MNDLTLFQYAGHDVRTITIDGEPWFVLADLCKVLTLGTPARVRDRLREGMSQTHTLQTPGGAQQMTVVSESGMYAVVLRSDKPEAGPFQDWVTGDVLPTIRRTGSYGAPRELTFEEKTLEVLKGLTAQVEDQRLELETTRPKAEAFDTFMDSDGCYSIGTVAKMLGLGQRRLFDELHARHVLIASGHLRNTPYSHLMHHFRVSAYTYDNTKTGLTGTSYTTKVRPSGVDYIRKKLGLGSAPMLDVA